MTPIFDRSALQVGWFDGENVFDLNLNWIAFSRNGNVFSAPDLFWLGPLREGSFIDQRGRPVGWLKGSSPSGSLKPMKPLTPLDR